MKFNKIKNILTTLLLAFALSSCNQSGGEKKCSTADNCGEGSSGGKTNIKDTITFLPSYFFDKAQNRWRTISVEELNGGGMGANLPIYSDFVNIPKLESMGYLTLASSQFQSPNSYSQSMHNRIPHIRIVARPDSTYIYSFQKLNLAGVEVAGKTGSLIIENGVAYLPFINDMFGGLFFPTSSTQPSSNFTYKLKLVAQSSIKKQSDVHTISFDATLVVPNKDFSLNYSEEMRNISLENRWHYFYDSVDGVPRTNLPLATMSDSTGTAESIPLDLKVIFKTKPILEMSYTIFNEFPLTVPDALIHTYVHVLRGNTFHEKTYTLTSERDFGINIKLNDTPVTLSPSGLEVELRDLPAGEVWSISFGYNLTQNFNYVSGKQLLKPLRSHCGFIKRESFNPIQERTISNNYKNIGGMLSVCHPDDFTRKVLTAEDISTNAVPATDSWFWSFSYAPQFTIADFSRYVRQRAGHFYGVKNVQFRISGCMKILAREAFPGPVNPNVYEIKNNESAECSTGPGDSGWMRYDISKTISIFDNTAQYSTVPGLREILDTYRNAVPKNTSNFRFNGDSFFEHIH